MKKAVLFQKLDGGKVKCLACRHGCKPAAGKSGFCGVRKNVDGDLYLSVYGKAIAVHVDPIEKKPLFHFMPGSSAFSFGTIGCNFRCSFCQNWDISQATAMVRERYKENPDESELMLGKICDEGQDLPPKKIVAHCVEQDIPVIAYTYTEPTIFAEYAGDTAELARGKGIKNVFVSNGYESDDCLEYMSDWCDAINIDIKAFTEDFYVKTCQSRLDGVLKTVRKAWDMGFWLECTTLVIPGLNDSDKELLDIANFIAEVSTDMPWHVTAFHADYKMKGVQSTPMETLKRAYRLGKDAGLKFVYTGNVMDGHENTLCPGCGEILVERKGMSCVKFSVDLSEYSCEKGKKWGHGKCGKCGEKIAGVWK